MSMYWFLHFWHICIFSPDIASLTWSPVCLMVVVITPPFLPSLLSVNKNGHEDIFDSDKLSDIFSNFMLAFVFSYFFTKHSHINDREDDPIAGIKIANALFAKSLVISFAHRGKLFFKKIYRHKITSFLFNNVPKRAQKLAFAGKKFKDSCDYKKPVFWRRQVIHIGLASTLLFNAICQVLKSPVPIFLISHPQVRFSIGCECELNWRVFDKFFDRI